jgi:hypothetical protein
MILYGGEWEFDTMCDCPQCSDWRDMHCPKCGTEWAWDGRTEQSRVCGECRYAHIERDPF